MRKKLKNSENKNDKHYCACHFVPEKERFALRASWNLQLMLRLPCQALIRWVPANSARSLPLPQAAVALESLLPVPVARVQISFKQK